VLTKAAIDSILGGGLVSQLHPAQRIEDVGPFLRSLIVYQRFILRRMSFKIHPLEGFLFPYQWGLSPRMGKAHR
jgi:hypothetical protein